MQKAELFEEVRSLLREPQDALNVADPQIYGDETLILQTRSALRHLSARGVVLTYALDEAGDEAGSLDNLTGLLVALRIASALLRGDMIQKVVSGQMGVLFRMGSDLIDTKTAARQFKDAAAEYEAEFRLLMTLALSIEGEVFGGPFAPGR